jgi:hypothetical protein
MKSTCNLHLWAGGDPPMFEPKERWTICYDGGGNGIANQNGESLTSQISNLFSNLSSSCRASLENAINGQINNQIDSLIINYIQNPLANCPPGQCRDVQIGILDTPNNNNGAIKVCCNGDDLDASNSDPLQGWVVGVTNLGNCG